jgi:hypothetical protein
MPPDERDRQFERALQRHLGERSADATCPDAEILAAYHERTLSVEEMAQWKEHIAACTRCQGMMALLEDTNSVPLHEWEQKNVPAHPETTLDRPRMMLEQSVAALTTTAAASQVTATSIQSAASRPKWKWIVPAGALAAGLLIYVGVRETRMKPGIAPIQVAENGNRKMQSAPTAAPVPEGNETDSLSQSLRGDSLGKAAVPAKKGVTVERSNVSSQTPRMPSAGAKASPAPAATVDVHHEIADGGLIVGTPKPAAPPLSALRAADSTGSVAMQERTTAVIRPAQSPASEAASELAAGASAKSKAAPAQAGNYMRMAKMAAEDRRYIVVSGGRVIWRLGAGGKIENSIDIGKSWVQQASGVASELMTGSAPSEKVCWIVGMAGTVLLTTDGGAHWKRITPPVEEDLTGVRAQDAQRATVWAAQSHKSFETTDGGTTWTPAANE